jgi:hypothetical protein
VAKLRQHREIPLMHVSILFRQGGIRQGGYVMAWSQMQPMQLKDALPFSCRVAEEEGSGSRGRTEIRPRGIEEGSPNTDILL